MIWINLWLGKYHILSILDSLNPNPHVFLASHVKLKEYRVIKKISKTNPFFNQLKTEAKFLSKYSSDFIPKLYDVEEDGENLYLVEEYVEGVGLASEEFLQNCLDEKELSYIVKGLLDFLQFINSLEESVLYIDWKPGNIILTKNGLKVVDFGSVIYTEGNDGFTPLATSGFAAPELIKGGVLGRATDIYGFGSLVRYLAEKNRKKTSLFKKSIRDKLLRLSSLCLKEGPDERPDIKDVEKLVKKLCKEAPLATQKNQQRGIIRDTASKMIAVCGAESGVGTTHIALLTAKELAAKGRKVAFLSLIRDEDGDETNLNCMTGLKNIRIYNSVSCEDVAFILKKGFDSIVIDFGRVDEFSLLFYSCDEKIIVIQNNLIKGSKSVAFLTTHRDDIGEKDWLIIDNLSDEASLRETRKILNGLKIKPGCRGIGRERI